MVARVAQDGPVMFMVPMTVASTVSASEPRAPFTWTSMVNFPPVFSAISFFRTVSAAMLWG